MSRIARFVGNSYELSHAVFVEDNGAYKRNTDNDEIYDTISSDGSTYTPRLAIKGFDFSAFPRNAIFLSGRVKIKHAANKQYSGTCNLIAKGWSKQSGCTKTTEPSIHTFGSLSSGEFQSLIDNPSNVEIRPSIYPDSTFMTYIYGAEIEVEYELPKNKVVYFGETLIDLTADTVTPDKLTRGYTAHDASGAIITGTAQGGTVYQDSDGYVVLSEEGWDGVPTGNLTVTENGTYDVSDYAGVTVDSGMGQTDLKSFIQRDTSSFTSITFPSMLNGIGPYAFASCSYLDIESLPSTVTYIREYAFYQCPKLVGLTSLPESVRSLGIYCFAISGIVSMALPSSITTIPQYLFYYCQSLESVSLPSGITSIGASAFSYCPSLALSSLPSSLTQIAANAFSRCYLVSLSEIPSSVTSIGDSAFRYCKSIESISCDGAITTLGNNAFTGETANQMSIASASFPNLAVSSLTTVFGSSSPASACHLLEFADIGNTASIAANAFANCYKLQTLVLRKTASVCTLANVSAFLNTPMSGYNELTGTVYVPSALVSSYQTATN